MNSSVNDGRLIRSSSLSRLQDEEDGRDQSQGNTYQNLSPPNGSVPHPGHRYFTPQPAKRKALKPNLSTKPQVSTRPPVFQKPQTPPVQENGSRQPKLTLTIPKRTGTFGPPSLDSGERTGSLDESFDSGTGSASAGISTKKAMKPPSAQSRGSLFKTSSITSTPTTPGSNVSVFTPDGLRVTPEYQEDEPLQPKRKAPTKPPIGRRKSDPLCNSRIRRAATLTDERQRSNDVDDENSKPKVSRNRTLEGGISPSEMEKYSGNRHRYFTPQPSRRKFSFRDGQGRVVSGNSSPAANFQQPYTRSPVERLANQMRSTKALDRPPSSETMSPETTPVNSPVKKPRTPTKAAPPPPNQASKNKPEPYDFVTDEEVNAAQRHVGGARRSRSLSGSSIQSKRRPLPSVPHRPRSGSASRADKDIPTVSSKAIQRKRRNRQSAPAGRVASILIDSNTSLHNAAAHSGASTAPGEKRRETLREELLRSLVDGTSKKEPSTLPIKKAGNITGEGMVNGVDNTNSLKQVEDSLKINMVREKSGYDEPDTAPRISPLPNKKNSVSPGGGTPTPPSSPGNSPSRQHPRRRRNKSSLSSLVSMPRNLVASNEFLNDILLSDRGSHKKLKAIVGFLVGLILGGLLFLGLYYGLDYPIYPALIITLVATAFMALSLAFTVRARCVAALMVPTICTSRGRAAFLTFIVTLLLRGPIHNIYLNSNEVSASMSCSAQLAYNQTREIQETAQRVLDAYVKGLLNSIDQIEDVVGQVQHLFEPVESGLDILNQGLDQASEALLQAANSCSDVVGSTYTDCTEKVGRVHADCMDFFSQQDILEPLDEICKIFDVTPVCAILDIGQGVCRFPSYVDETIDNSLAGTRRALQTAISKFSPDLDFSHVSEKIVNQSTTSELVQEAIQQELDKAYSKIDWVLAISDKILALSFVWLCIKSYIYHTSYRYKDSFDNQYITAKFKKLDSSRKERGASHLLPLKRHEKNQLIDVTALLLSKSEKQYLTLGLSRVLLHAIIAVILMLMDFFLYWLLLKIQEHGRYEVDFSAGTEASFGINFGRGVFSEFLRLLFAEGFEATTVFNTTLNTTQCLPQPIPPNNNLAIAISFLYATTIVMVLSQAYARRLLRYIAAYYYPEREKERIAYLYRRTLQKRQTIRKMLRDAVKMNKKERDANERAAGEQLGRAAAACNDILGSAYRGCYKNLNNVHIDCQAFMTQRAVPHAIAQVCKILDADAVCSFLKINSICETPAHIDNAVNGALDNARGAMQGLVDSFSADVDFSRYFEKRSNASTTTEHIQQAISQELDQAYSYVDWILSISDKLLALSFVWLCFKSYMYHSSYRTKDSFDNQYVTAQFKRLDATRKEGGQPYLLPLKKNERNRLIDVTAVRLCKSEKGYFKFGLSTVVLHSIIAGLLMFIDFGLFWLLSKIKEHGDVQIATSGEASTEIDIGGTGVVADLVRIVLNEGFKASSAFNSSLDTTVCLPGPIRPDKNLAIIISVLYVVTILMTLSQAYAQRLLRYIASYYYPEREVERIMYLYGRTLQKRQTLMKMLCQSVKRNKKEKDAYNKISISSYLTMKYPCCKSLFTMCGFKQTQCLGCSSLDDGLLVYCSDQGCDGVYCEECARALQGKCTLCESSIDLGKIPLDAEQKS